MYIFNIFIRLSHQSIYTTICYFILSQFCLFLTYFIIKMHENPVFSHDLLMAKFIFSLKIIKINDQFYLPYIKKGESVENIIIFTVILHQKSISQRHKCHINIENWFIYLFILNLSRHLQCLLENSLGPIFEVILFIRPDKT